MWILGGLLAAVGLIAFSTVGSFYCRRFSWYVVVWLPMVLILSVFWLFVLAGATQGGWGSLGPFILAICASPSLIVLALLAWNYPRNIRSAYVLGGLLLLVCICGLFFRLTTRTITFVVTDPTGNPVSGLHVQTEYPNMIWSTSRLYATTNAKGIAAFYPPKAKWTTQSYFNAKIDSTQYGSGGYSGIRCMIDSRGNPHTEKVWVSWEHFDGGNESIYALFSDKASPALAIPLVVGRSEDSYDLGLLALWRKQWPNAELHDLTWRNYCDTEKMLSLYQGKINTGFDDLRQLATGLRVIDSVQRYTFDKQAEARRGKLCEYLTGTDPVNSIQRIEVLRDFTQERANIFIRWLEPSLLHGRAGFQILEELGPLARPLAGKFADLYIQADSEGREALLSSLFQIGPAPQDVCFLLGGDDQLFQHFLSAMRTRSRKQIAEDSRIIDEWLAVHPGKLTQDQLNSIKGELEDRRR